MKSKEDTNCPICGPVFANHTFMAIDRLHGLEGEFTYAQCPKCGLLIMTSPINKEAIANFYPDSYSAHNPYVFESEAINNRNRNLSNFQWLIHIAKGYITHLKEWLKGTKIKRFVHQNLTESSRVLDVGCGTGEFLYGLKMEKGVQVYGVEISDSAAKRGAELYDVEIFNGELAAAPLRKKSFDLITAWWSIEHIPDPEEIISLMNKLLCDEGNLIIGIPNSKSINAWIFKSRWYHLDCPRHLHLWTIPAIKTLLRRNGLMIETIVFDKTPWGLLGSLQYLFYQNNYSEKNKNRITRNFVLYFLLLPWTIMVGLLRLSDIMVIYCKKSSQFK